LVHGANESGHDVAHLGTLGGIAGLVLGSNGIIMPAIFLFLKKMDEKSNKNLRFNKVVDPACQKKIPRNSRRPEEPKIMLRVTIFLPWYANCKYLGLFWDFREIIRFHRR
jgi:hypothetical protein